MEHGMVTGQYLVLKLCEVNYLIRNVRNVSFFFELPKK